MIYTDFSKAFDRVNHNLLLYKLSSYIIHPYVLRLLRNYLNCRMHSVVLDGHYSNWNIVPSGVPRGSIFVNDIPDCLSNKCLLFADDLNIFNKIHSPASLLQDDLD